MNLRRNAIANYLGQGWTSLISFACIPLYIRYMGIEAYGLVGIFALLQTWLSLLDLGLTPAISREMARFTAGAHNEQSIRDLLRSVEIIVFGIAMGVSVGIWASSEWLASNWLQAQQLPVATVARALAIMGGVAGMRFVENIYQSSMMGLQRQVRMNVVNSAVTTLRGLGAVAILMWVSPTISAFFIWQGFVSVLALAIFAAVVHRSLPYATRAPRFSVTSLKAVWRFATGTVLLTLLGFVLSQSDKLILTKLITLKSFAIYSLAYAIASVVRQLAQPVDQAVYPRLTQLYEQNDESALAALYHKSSQYKTVLVGGIGAFLAIFGERVLTLWTQDAMIARDTYAVLWILIAGMILNATMNGPYYLQLAAGWTELLVKVNAWMVVVFLPVIYVLTMRFHIIGAAISWVLLNLTYVIVVARLVHRRLLQGEMKAWYLKDLVMPLSAGVAVATTLRWLTPGNAAPVSTVLALAFSLASILVAASLAAESVRGDVRFYVRQSLSRYT